MEDRLLLQISSDSDPALVLCSRRGVAAAVPDEFRDGVADVLTITSELVANAVEHADGTIEVRLRQCGRSLRVEVDDHGVGWPVLREPGLLDESGRGLLIVDGLSDRWGVDRHSEDGKTMWAEIACR